MRERTNNTKGAIAETALEFAAIKAGIYVYRPVSGHSRADFIFDLGFGPPLRVQCKWATLSQNAATVVIGTRTSRHTPNGYVRTCYSEHEIDLVGAYCEDLDRCFLLPPSLFAGQSMVQLRLTPARNNQRACINLAEDFTFEGAIAQLGERLTGSQEVVGSSPTSSTPPRPSRSNGPTVVGSNPFRDHLGDWMERVAAGEEVIITRRGRPRIRLSPAVAAPVVAALPGGGEPAALDRSA